MTTESEDGKMLSNEELLKEAAEGGISFVPGSIQEYRFLHFCYRLWIRGSDAGIKRTLQNLSEMQANRNRTETKSV